MRTRGLAPSLLLALALPAAAQEAPADPWAGPLAEAGLAPGDVRIDPDVWRGGGRLALPTFEARWADWRSVAPWGEALGRRAAAAPTLDALVRLAAEGLAAAEERPWSDDPREGLGLFGGSEVEPFVTALSELQSFLGVPLDDDDVAEVVRSLARVPRPVRDAAAEVLALVPLVWMGAHEALGLWGDHPTAARRTALAWASYADPGDAELARVERLDLRRLLSAGDALAAGVERAGRRLEAAPVTSAVFEWTWDTPLGRIHLAGAGAQHHRAGRTLLLVDAAGDDRHDGGASTLRGQVPLSVVIDAAGDDVYETAGEAAFGAGILGIAIQADLAGNDRYRARALSLGCGVLGVGLLLDAKGDDRYQVRHQGQGAGTAGLGLLLDRQGDDRYRCLQRAQAFGQVRGAGLLVDLAGRDEYVAQDDVVVAPAPQTAEHNTSLAQGCGFGRRAHPGDGRSLAGGLGLLVDGGGDDVYRCGVFGQGTAYWYALGYLVDLGGDDDYLGAYYAQAAAAHYAVAGLVDAAGNDRHRVTLAQSLGQGQDLSIGVLHDRAGDDRYASRGHSMGVSILNGIGVLQDDGGDDEYLGEPGSSCGDPGQGTARPGVPAFGLFLDGGGGARFPADHPRARSGATWVVPGTTEHPRAIGVGRAAP